MRTSPIETLEPRTLLSNPITFGGSTYDTVSKVVAYPDGGEVVAGLFTGTADFDPTSRQVNLIAQEDRADVFIARYSAAGRLVWVRQFSSDAGKIKADERIDTPTDPSRAGPFDLGVGLQPANLGIYITSLAVDSIGNIYFAGGFRGSVNFLRAPAQRVLTSDGGRDYLNTYFGRLNSGGNLSFVRQINSPFTTIANDMVLDSSNDVYLTGYFTRSANFNVTGGDLTKTTSGREDVFTAKYDSVGRLIWVNNSSTDETDRAKRNAGNSIAVNSGGEVFVAGTFSSETRFDPAIKSGATTLDALRDTDTFVEMINPNGTLGWVAGFGGKGFDGATALTLSSDGQSVYVGSYFEGTIDVNPGAPVQDVTATPDSPGDTPDKTDLLISKFSATNGALIFAEPLVAGDSWETLGALVTDSAGNVYATGGFYDTANFNPKGTFNLTSTLGIQKFHDANDGDRDHSYNVFVTSLDSAGSFRFATSFGSASDNYGTSIALNTGGDLIVAGQFRGTYFFPNSSDKLRSLGAQDGFVAIFDTTGGILPG